MPELKPVPLLNGRYAYEDQPGAAVVLYGQILHYFEHGLRLEPGMAVFDVGGNVGLFALEVLHRTDGRARVFCFEPAPRAFALMARCLREQFPDADVHPIPAGLGATPGEATFYYRPGASAMSSFDAADLLTEDDVRRLADTAASGAIREEYKGHVPRWLGWLPRPVGRWLVRQKLRQVMRRVEPVRCPVTTVSRAMREYEVGRIDLLKIDVEGAEWDVLEGIEAADWPKIGAVTIEVHDIAGRVGRVCDLLRAHGFAHVHTSQEDVFRGTSVYGVRATR